MGFASLRKMGKKAAATVMAVATAATVMVTGTGVASADNRDWLRPDYSGQCDWDPVMYWVQRCDVWSESMGRNIAVQIQPAARGGNAGLYLLDGMRATERANAWTVDTNAPAKFVDNNITLVMPIGGAGSFYADWSGPATFSQDAITYKWETFLTSELPTYLADHFGVAYNNNSIAGLSMGGTAALNLAAKHPGQFRQALSYSGYLTMSTPGMQALLGLAMLDVGGFNINAMYGGVLSTTQYENDPYMNMAGLAGKDVYVSAASGIPAQADFDYYGVGNAINGAVLEWFSKNTTRSWEAKARGMGLNVTSDYPISGVHNWLQWDWQLNRTHDRILDVMNAW